MAETNGSGATNGVHANGKATYAEKHNLPAHFIGGNSLENAPPSKVKDFVASHDGHTVITNVGTLKYAQDFGLGDFPRITLSHG
jgi:acetyl-CoA carboxylase/biotin carboxylase 1